MSFDTIAVRVKNLSKKYAIYPRPIDRLREWLSRGKKRLHHEIWGLRDVSLEVPGGSTLGIVGSNGAGKSTLLKVLAGTTMPTRGHFEIHGRVSSLLELGTGFYEGFTGLQNIYMSAMVMGFSRKEIEARVPEIIEFSELGPFIQQPIRTYSSGMVMRLGFSVATAIDPDVLIIDEILAVGDLHFQKRCIDRILSFRKAGKTILFCSHSLYQVEEICDHTIWVQDGQIRMHDESQKVVRAYENFERQRRGGDLIRRIEQMGEERSKIEPIALPDAVAKAVAESSQPSERLPHILAVRLRDPRSNEVVERGRLLEDLLVEIDYELPEDLSGMVVGSAIYRSDQIMIAGLGTNLAGMKAPSAKGLYRAHLVLPRLHLLHGEYTLVAYVTDERGIHIYHSKRLPGQFQVDQPTRHVGIIYLDHEWRVNPLPEEAALEYRRRGSGTIAEENEEIDPLAVK